MDRREEFLNDLYTDELFLYNDPILFKEILRVLGKDTLMEHIIYNNGQLFDEEHDPIAKSLMEYTPFTKYLYSLFPKEDKDDFDIRLLYTLAKYIIYHEWIIPHIEHTPDIWTSLVIFLTDRNGKDFGYDDYIFEDVSMMIEIIEKLRITIDSEYIIECIEDEGLGLRYQQYPEWENIKRRIQLLS